MQLQWIFISMVLILTLVGITTGALTPYVSIINNNNNNDTNESSKCAPYLDFFQVSTEIKFSVNTTFNDYMNNQMIQKSWDNVQQNVRIGFIMNEWFDLLFMQLVCCGVVAFTDYEDIFNNFSIPVSCCNTTNPLANKTTCSFIVRNAVQANQTGLVYSKVLIMINVGKIIKMVFVFLLIILSNRVVLIS